MKYLVKRFSSLKENITESKDYILDYFDGGLDRIDDITEQLIQNPRIKDLRPVKRYGRLTKSVTQLLKRKKKSKEKKYSLSSSQTKDPTTSLNSEANKFRVSLNRLTNSMSTDTQSLVD